MQEACEETDGAMLSLIGLDADAAGRLAAQCSVEVANFNSPEQTVLSGRREGIRAAAEMAPAAGAKRALMLKVAGAYHSSLMRSAGDKMRSLLADVPIVQPRFPVLSNVTGAPHGSPDAIRENMVRQVTSPVRWIDCVRTLAGLGVGLCVECGPGRVLSGLAKRIDPKLQLCNVQDSQSLKAAVELLGRG